MSDKEFFTLDQEQWWTEMTEEFETENLQEPWAHPDFYVFEDVPW